MMITLEVNSATQISGQSRFAAMHLCSREPGGRIPLFTTQLIQLTVFLLVRVSTNEIQHANGLILEVDACALLQFLDQRGIELLAGAFEVVHRATFGAPASHRQKPRGC